MDFRIHKSSRYHEKFRSFYEWLHNAAVLATAVSSTSAFFLLLASQPEIATWLTAIIGVSSILDLLFQFEKKARIHDELRRRFTSLAADTILRDPSTENLRWARSELLRIEGDEPGLRRLIDIQARNEEARARGCAEEDIVPLSRPQRYLGYFGTFDMKRIEHWKAIREKQKDSFPIG
ncbi:hypothetical protein [Agrobacterium rosae]|uniref:hypothetical protein n=1 Tax=Agrobacterium rosae TaxID=1972867 RepID=UPI00097DE0D5|nr:hypothetical protein [Agrobacterium rosae]